MGAHEEPGLDEAMKKVIEKHCRNLELKKMQRIALELLWKGDTSIMISLPTGYGKSLVYQLGGELLALKKKMEKWVTVVVSPLNVIQRDQMSSLREKNISALRLDMGGQLEFQDGTETELNAAIQADIEAGKYQFIFAHPEALLCSDAGLALLCSSKFCGMVALLAVDECHTIDTWGKEFRVAFRKLGTLPSYFKGPVIALSATLTASMWTEVPKHLGITNVARVCENPDKPNIFLNRKRKPGHRDIIESSESVFMPELTRLKAEDMAYPVTLCYMPLEWCVNAQIEALSIFGKPDLYTTKYAILFSTQDPQVIAHITQELKKNDPQLRLVFCSPALGMGFDSPCVSRVIHARPPRSIVDFAQQIGRAGHQGQASESLLYFSANDIGPNTIIDEHLKEFCLTDSCLRLVLLKAFGCQDSPLSGSCKCCCNCAKSCACERCITGRSNVSD